MLYYERMMTRTFWKIAAWLLLCAIVFVTVSPIGLRPHTITTVNLDRAMAFAVMAFAFLMAYPRYWRVVTVLIVAGAIGIETLQYLSPTRHPEVADAIFKAAGAMFGALAARVSHNRIGRPDD